MVRTTTGLRLPVADHPLTTEEIERLYGAHIQNRLSLMDVSDLVFIAERIERKRQRRALQAEKQQVE